MPTQSPEAKPRIRNQGSCQGIRGRGVRAHLLDKLLSQAGPSGASREYMRGSTFLAGPFPAVLQALPGT